MEVPDYSYEPNQDMTQAIGGACSKSSIPLVPGYPVICGEFAVISNVTLVQFKLYRLFVCSKVESSTWSRMRGVSRFHRDASIVAVAIVIHLAFFMLNNVHLRNQGPLTCRLLSSSMACANAHVEDMFLQE